MNDKKPGTIQRFSSRREHLYKSFLATRLRDARSYKRIAGYFRSSIFELIGEEIEAIAEVKILCNSELDALDLQVSQTLRDAKMKEKWNEGILIGEPLLYRNRYRRLYELLTNGNLEIRVVPKEILFLHGKAGVIERPDGTKTSFIGSVNETRRAFQGNYELVWEDSSQEAVKWVEEEFDALWPSAIPLPQVLIKEIKRLSEREEIELADCKPEALPAAALAESPLYISGEQLQPWQKAFVMQVLRHRETYENVRLLLADEVGLGKTLSLGASALMSVLLDEGPVLILTPSTLTAQWQIELKDKLGVPTARWDSQKKMWIDAEEHKIPCNSAEGIKYCPYQIAIVSTGLITHLSREREILLNKRFGMIILDEAHKARYKKELGKDSPSPNNLLDFMLQAGKNAKHILLGTATPIQTEIRELWDLMLILNSNRPFVLGREPHSSWLKVDQTLPIVTGRERLTNPKEAWDFIRNPLPSGQEDRLFDQIRSELDMKRRDYFCSTPFSDLHSPLQDKIRDSMEETIEGMTFFERQNPLVRHTVMRYRKELEKQGLLPQISVSIHPNPSLLQYGYPGFVFDEQAGLPTNRFFERAYRAAEEFTQHLRKRMPAAGFLKMLLLRRICSSFAAGISTANKLLQKQTLEEEEITEGEQAELSQLTTQERNALLDLKEALSDPEAFDPKLKALCYFLTQHHVEKKTWLEHGCIIFSQYYDTAAWTAKEIALILPHEPIAVYAGAGKSRLYLEGKDASVKRDCIKESVKNREIRLVVATDAACEGLNLQTLGTLINIDLPWNPSRLEQRLGRIKRFGQTRASVDMLNLVYQDTLDEKIYQVLSRRMKDRYDIFGALPDVLQDEWIENIETLEKEADLYWSRRQELQNAFKLRYHNQINPDQSCWEQCAKVLSRQNILQILSEPW